MNDIVLYDVEIQYCSLSILNAFDLNLKEVLFILFVEIEIMGEIKNLNHYDNGS